MCQIWVMHLVLGQEISSPVHDVKTVSYNWYCQGGDGFQFGWGVQLRLEYHPNPGVVLFPDLLFQRVLDSVSLADFEVLIGTFLF